MPIYLVTPLANNFHEIIREVEMAYAREDFFTLANSAGVLVRDKGTTIEVSNKVGITTPDRSTKTGSAMVTSVGSYYGRGQTDMWEWLRTRFEGMV